MLKLGLIFLSAVLLVLAFPLPAVGILAWFGLVPLLFAVERVNRRGAFGLAYLCGFVFFAGTLHWVTRVTWLGFFALVAYLALYFALFGLGANIVLFQRGSEVRSQRSEVNDRRDSRALSRDSEQAIHSPHPLKSALRTPHSALFLIPALWVALEYLRSHLFTGFGWGLLAYSQTKNLSFIQIADLTGPWGVSFLLVMVNVAVFLLFKFRIPLPVVRGIIPKLLVPLLIAASVFIYGSVRLKSFARKQTDCSLAVAVIQGNVPQQIKWLSSVKIPVLEQYLILSGLAVTDEEAGQRPEMVIWPETAVTGCLLAEPELTGRIKELAEDLGVFLLVGSPTFALKADFNSATLITPGGEISTRYDKLHLVPFGEYVPLDRIFGRFGLFPESGDFQPGGEFTVFSLPGDDRNSASSPGPVRFACVICFEDVIPGLVREFRRQGADFLVNITNDAWFGETGAPYQHAQASVFRAVEHRIPVVRAANTGLSCFIDPAGRITSRVTDKKGKDIFIAGYQTDVLSLSSSTTLYGRFGDWFAYLNAVFVLSFCLGRICRERRRRP